MKLKHLAEPGIWTLPNFDVLGLAAGTGVLSKIAGNEMTYRISYDDGLFTVGPAGVTRTEYYRTEFEAMKRARQLLEKGDHHGIAVHDGMGEVLTGIRLELKLGMQVAD